MNYQSPIRYFLTLTSMLLLTGIWMFILHTNLSFIGTVEYYEKKTVFGLLETVSPHLFGMSIIFFILTHFFAVIKNIEIPKWISWLFILMLVSNFSGFFVSNFEILALVKLVSTILMILISFYMFYKLFKIS